MKQHMGNGKWKTNVSLPVSLIIFFLLLTAQYSILYAASPKKKLTQIRRQLEKKKQKVKETIKKEKSVLERIADINAGIKKKQQELKKYDRQISEAQSNILHLSKEITLLNGKLDKRKDYLKDRLKALYKQQYGGNALILITAKDYQDLITKSKYLSLIAYHDSRIITTYNDDLEEINSKKANLELQYKKIEQNKKDAQKKKKELQTDRIKKDRLLATIRSKRASYEKTIKELEQSSKKLQQMIKRLAKRKVPKSVTGKGFRALRGHLPWPVNGKVVIPYGEYKDPKFNIPVFKNGLEIRAKKGEKPKAVAGGRVVYADWFKGYGLLLIINHGSGYHSLYGNLSEIFHKTGDIINKGSSVGIVGNSRLLNFPALYFEIRYKGKPVDPAKWLKRKGR